MVKKFNKLFDRIRRKYFVSIADVLRFIGLAAGNFLLFFIPLWLSLDLSLPKETNPNFTQSLYMGLSSIVLVVITYFRDNYRDKKKNNLIVSDKIIYDCIGGGIQELYELKDKDGKEKGHYITETLNYIEKVTFAILRAHNKDVGQLCVNIMENIDGKLKLTKFATKFQDRTKPAIELDLSKPGPGAPFAWVNNQVIYVADISLPQYKPFFDGDFKFKSFISLPLEIDGTVIAIVNIDSNLLNQFESNEFISKFLIPKINPFLLLLRFDKDLFTNK